MKSSKLVGILACFSKEQWNQFEHFLHLPYLNVHKRHHEIYAYLKSRYWRQKRNRVEKEGLFPLKSKLCAKFFPDDQKDYKRLNKHLSNLHRHAQSFLALEQLRKAPDELDIVSTQVAIHAKEYHYAEVAINRLWKKMEKETEDWFLRSELCFANNLLQDNINPKKKISSLVKVEESLDDLYLFHQIRNYCLQFTQQIQLGSEATEYRPYFETYIEHYIARRQYIPALFRIYYCILKILKRENAPSFLHALTQLLQNHKTHIPKFNIKEVQTSLLNHHILLYHSHKIKGQELLNVYQVFLQAGTLVDSNGYLSLKQYRSLIIIASKAKTHEWLKSELIDKHLYLLEEKNRELASFLAKGEYEFICNNWKEAFNLASQIVSEDIIFKFSRGTLLVQAAYEMEKHNIGNSISRYEFSRTLQNFIALLNYYKSTHKRIVQVYLSFANAMQRIYNIESAKNKQNRATQVLNSIKTLKEIAKKDWLIEKARAYQL